jgi:hypothetical protein
MRHISHSIAYASSSIAEVPIALGQMRLPLSDHESRADYFGRFLRRAFSGAKFPEIFTRPSTGRRSTSWAVAVPFRFPDSRISFHQTLAFLSL